jgi:F-box protein 21
MKLTLYFRSADDKSVRYVAEENITVLEDTPTQNLLELAGRYFKRWDDEEKVFVSNIRDEYPHD